MRLIVLDVRNGNASGYGNGHSADTYTNRACR